MRKQGSGTNRTGGVTDTQQAGLRGCPTCDCRRTRKFATTHDRHYGYFDRMYDVFECTVCGLLFLNPMIGERELMSMYREDSYYAYEALEPERSDSTLRAIARSILLGSGPNDPKFDLSVSRRMLDIGCGSGAKLREMKRKGWDVAGVEISAKACAIANRHRLSVSHGTLAEIGFSSESFDYVRSNHSFEHLVNPRETLKEIHRICKPDALILLGVPNTDSFAFKVFGKYWYFLGVPFHPFNYNCYNLRLLLEECGFEIVRIRYNSRHQGLRGSIRIWLNRNSRRMSSEGPCRGMASRCAFVQLGRALDLLRMGDCIEVTSRKV